MSQKIREAAMNDESESKPCGVVDIISDYYPDESKSDVYYHVTEKGLIAIAVAERKSIEAILWAEIEWLNADHDYRLATHVRGILAKIQDRGGKPPEFVVGEYRGSDGE